jgi:hypothetical protein
MTELVQISSWSIFEVDEKGASLIYGINRVRWMVTSRVAWRNEGILINSGQSVRLNLSRHGNEFLSSIPAHSRNFGKSSNSRTLSDGNATSQVP